MEASKASALPLGYTPIVANALKVYNTGAFISIPETKMNAKTPRQSPLKNQHQAKVLSKTLLAPDIYEITLSLPKSGAFNFKAGQCAGFCITKNYKRLYSFSSAPSKSAGSQSAGITFCVDTSPMGRASKFVSKLKPGQSFKIEGPYGVFTVDDMKRNLLFVATGVGIAPFKAIIDDLFARGFKRKITLLFGVRSQQNLFYHDYFAALAKKHKNFEFIQALSRPKGKWNEKTPHAAAPHKFTGRVTDYLQKNYKLFARRDIYICGSPQMISSVYEVLQQKGHSYKNTFTEEFV